MVDSRTPLEMLEGIQDVELKEFMGGLLIQIERKLKLKFGEVMLFEDNEIFCFSRTAKGALRAINHRFNGFMDNPLIAALYKPRIMTLGVDPYYQIE